MTDGRIEPYLYAFT